MNEKPPINWFGAFLVTRKLLAWSKGAVDDVSNSEHFTDKVNRVNFVARVQGVMIALNTFGPNEKAAEFIQGTTHFFTDVDVKAFGDKLAEIVADLSKNTTVQYDPIELGLLDFSDVPGELPGCGIQGCDSCGSGDQNDCVDDDDDDWGSDPDVEVDLN